MNQTDPNATFAHSSPLEQWWERFKRHAGPSYADKNPARNYLNCPSGIPGLSFNYGATQGGCFAELYIKPTAHGSSEATFDNLRAHRDDIEKAFGEKLIWDRMEGFPTCRIRFANRGGYASPREHWFEIQTGIVGAMDRLQKALGPYLRELR